ncbi:MAG TPA: type IV secretory system conjugative DNA transfer family protein [Pyrinomonadaceae bacterium]|nr:type IV secretory system conjugative DNA transfer family protein [Pyrinomonadaceae bacterium]
MTSLHIGFDSANRPLHLSAEDRKTHMHVIGSSGSGKSKFLEWMIRGDLNNRQGFAMLDPHGTLYETVADYCAHKVPRRDVIFLNLSQPNFIVGFNPFQRTGDADISVQVDRRITATMHAWDMPNTDQTPTLARTLRLIYTVMLEMNLGLPQVAHLIDFNAHEIRSHLIEQLESSLVQREWRELQALKAKEWRDETLSAKNRLFKFLTSPTLGRFMGVQGRTLNLQDIMDQGKVLLVNLAPSDHLSHENARVFGSLLVNEFFECALRRKKDRLGSDPHPFYLYMDEFQNFVSLDIAEMLDQVRKFGLFQILAHQRFGHLDEDLTDAVLTNCKIKAVFGGLPTASAKLMAEELFIGELDPKKIKAAIYQTKFWPTYRRDKVYTKTSTRGESFASGSSDGSASISASSASEMFSGPDWFGASIQVGQSTGWSSASSQTSGHSESHVVHDSESEGVSDIPIFVPVPFQELSSVQYYSLDEQLVELTAALKEQYGRHCFIKIQQQATQPMLVPFVDSYHTSEENKSWYFVDQLSKASALPAGQVDQLLESQEHALLKAATSQVGPTTNDTPAKAKSQVSLSGPKRGRSARANLFSSINIKDD